MPDLDLTEITDARSEAARLAEDLRAAEVALERARRGAAAAAARGGRAEAERALAEALRLERERESLFDRRARAAERVRELSESIVAAVTPERAIGALAGDLPVLLLPVRLETRFFDDGDTLKVRVFPDQVHVTAHDPAATDDEVAGLAWYWEHRWADQASDALAEEAWQGLTARLRPGRAAFLVRQYPPVDPAARAPELPDIPRRAADAVVPGTAGLLPDRWCAIGYRRTGEGEHAPVFTVWGSAVPDTLAAGPGIGRGPADATDDDLASLEDPAAAARAGMLLTVRQRDCAAGFRLRDGVDRLVVLGVDWTRGPEQTAAAVQEHLAAHAGQGRLGFVRQGSPTNSTGEQRSGYTTDPTVMREVLAPHLPPSQQPDAAGAVLADALGLPGEALAHLPGAGLREQSWQGALLASLWSATGGYYLTEMLDPLADDAALERALRRHVADHLRPGGPLPTLRVAAQPYGVLPVLPRQGYRPDRGDRAERAVHRVSTAMRRLAEPLVAQVPRLGQVRTRGDVDDILLALLQRTPVAWSLTFRNLIGHERHALGVYWMQLAAYQRSVTSLLMAELGATEVPMLADLTHDPDDHPLNVPLVLRTEPDGSRGTGYLAEIAELLTRGDGRTILDGRQDASALLEALLACAAVREIDRAAKSSVAQRMETVALADPLREYVLRQADRLPVTLRVEEAAPVAEQVPSTPEEFSRMVIPGLTGSATIASHVAADLRAKVRDLSGLLGTPQDPVYDLGWLRASLATLQQAPADELEWAFRSVLDVYATRLDAWITSLATARLRRQREARPAGLHVGGWGLVEELRPDRGAASESLGYVHTPSLRQAASTAVLRSARAAHRDATGRAFDLDLSSQRVRHALAILEGVAQGQRLAALLGYRFERALHESGNGSPAQWIPALRRLFPLRSDRPDDPAAAPATPAWEAGDQPQPVESVAARDVVDGVALLDRYERDGAALWAGAGIAAGQRAAVDAAARQLADLADAVSDVLVAEAVHQATSGNLERAGAALAAHDQQGPPPDPEFVRTPRAGHTVAHRVGVWLPAGDPGPAPGWPADLRSIAEPRLDRWLGGLLGDPGRWSVGGSLHRAAEPDQAPVDLGSAGPADLGLGALSLVLAARRPGPGQPSALAAMLQQHLLVRAGQAPLGPADQVLLDGADLAEMLDLAGWAADVAGARPISGADFAATDDVVASPATAGGVDAAEAVGRADAVAARAAVLLAALQQARDAWDGAPTPAAAAALAAAIRALHAVPKADAAAAPGDLAAQAAAVISASQGALAAVAALPPAASAVAGGDVLDRPAGDPQVERAGEIVGLLLGTDQPFLPLVRPPDPLQAVASLADRDALLAGDAHAAVTWLHRTALVRPELEPLSALLANAEADGAPVGEQLRLVQSPHRPGRPWTALPFGEAGPPEHGSVALLLHAPRTVDPQIGGAGVIVDDWAETIPATHDTTAVTFHYDAPGARAPQTMLLAVHPQPASPWSLEHLTGCVAEAADLARLRTLSSRELAPFATFLPALFLPEGYTRDTPGVRIRELVAHLEHLGTGGLVIDHVLGKGGGDA